ncbi:probable WRKY transcription factor 27 isoform X1 [Quercus suber]|uniref:Wrky transcription factor 27 n=1 Tax=Quercus suber TaxID=58331 RepID=A0AAW0KEZ4_QUESU|nr:probable WRKY transcription factor 27 isoform X1 [Quercus suber]
MTDWDLNAVVRSCKYSTTTTTTNTTAASENPLSCLASLTFKEESDPFSFPQFVEPRTDAFQELQELCKPFFPTTTTTTTTFTTTSHGVKPNSSISDLQHRLHGSSSFGFRGILDQQRLQGPRQQQQQQQVYQQEFLKPQASSPMSLPTMQSQVPRARKRKNQQKRTVRHVTADNLSADVWAWRKYGQKPIKGSPYPRNYYRCSSTKGCPARKQVERSNTDPNTFIITYTGEHTHPRPTHRNSLAGSVRNKFKSTDAANTNGNITSCLSPQSASCLSPTTPLTVLQTDEEAANLHNINEETDKMIDGNDKESEEMVDDEEDDDILIPNIAMNEDIFMGLQELGYGNSPGGGSGDNFSGGSTPRGGASSGSSWAPCGSAAAVGGC